MNTKTKTAKADDLQIEARLSAARLALNQCLLTATGDSAALRANVRELEAEQQRLANEEAAAEAAKRAAAQSAAAERESAIRLASKTLQEARTARLDAVRSHFSVRTVPDMRSSFAG